MSSNMAKYGRWWWLGSLNFNLFQIFFFQKLPSFPELAKILSVLCLSDDPEDCISLDASVCLGKLCVADVNAKSKLRQLLRENPDHYIRAEVIQAVAQSGSRTKNICHLYLNYNDRHLLQSPVTTPMSTHIIYPLNTNCNHSPSNTLSIH